MTGADVRAAKHLHATTGTYAGGARRRGIAAALAAFALLLVGLMAPAPAPAALETVLQDDAQLLHRPEDQLRRSLEELRLLGVDRLRITAGWSVLTRDADAKTKPADFNAADPFAYEQDRFRNLDRLLVLAREYGFKTMLDIAFWAPKWASADAPEDRGRTNINAEEFRDFAVAVARRYSGTYIVPRAVASAPPNPLRPSNDEQFLRAGYGDTSPRGEGSLHDALGVGWLGGERGAAALAGSLGTEGTAATVPLPKVEVFTLWNEPNHTSFMRPQWVRVGKGRSRRWVPRSPHIYRGMVAKAYPAIKAARPDSTILIGGTSVSGSYGGKGTGNVPPLRFLRELACVDSRLRPKKGGSCAGFHTIPGDGWAHHPYSMRTEPDARASVNRPDDLPLAELPRLAHTLDRLIGRGRVAPALRNLWITEYGYETNPPDPDEIFTPGDQARFLTWAEYLASRVPTVKTFAQFLLRDLPPGAFRVGKSKRRPFGEWQSGVLFEDGRAKLSALSFRAGLFVQRLRGGRLRLWGRLRMASGARTVILERRPSGSQAWKTISTVGPGAKRAQVSFSVDGRDAFQRFAKAPRGRAWRYRIRYQEDNAWRTSPSVSAIER